MDNKTIIGRVEKLQLVDYPGLAVPAKVDSGADISSIWASNIRQTEHGLEFCLFGKGSAYHSAVPILLPKGSYRLTLIANSFGTKERRYVVDLRIVLLGRQLTCAFTLANRSTKIYPMLLGRNILEQDFLVDVTKGQPLIAEEQKQLKKMHVELSEREE